MYVCNRTGKEDKLNFEGSASVVVAGGRRLIEYSRKQPAILSVDVGAKDWSPHKDTCRVLEL